MRVLQSATMCATHGQVPSSTQLALTTSSGQSVRVGASWQVQGLGPASRLGIQIREPFRQVASIAL